MAKGKKKGGLGNRAIRLSTMKKHPPKSAGGTHGGTGKIGRTIIEKAHPSHPGMEFVAARGPAHGKKPSDKALVGPQERRTKRKEKKK